MIYFLQNNIKKIMICLSLFIAFIIVLKYNHDMDKTTKQIVRKTEALTAGPSIDGYKRILVSDNGYYCFVSTEVYAIYQVGDFYNGNWKK